VANLLPVSTITVANLSPVSMTPVAKKGNNFRLQYLHFEVNSKEKIYLHLNCTTQRCFVYTGYYDVATYVKQHNVNVT
jgi:hypothetical protein